MSLFKKKEAEAQDPEATIAVLQEALQEAQETARDSQRELKHLELSYADMHAREHRARKHIQYWQNKYDAKAAELTETAADLTEAKNALFEMQPPGQVPDNQIASEWSKLCQAIEQWVDEHLHIDPRNAQKHMKRFFECKRVKEALKERLVDFWDEEREEITSVGREMLENGAIIGLIGKESAFITYIPHLLAELTPQRENASIALWRSETLKALCSTQQYAIKREMDAKDVLLECREFLSWVVGRSIGRFEQEVLKPAIAFDALLRQSISTYEFVFEPLSDKPPQDELLLPSKQSRQRLYLSCFERADVISIKTGRKITVKMLAEAENNSLIGQKVLVIHPALCCRREERELVLGKQLILAEFSK